MNRYRKVTRLCLVRPGVVLTGVLAALSVLRVLYVIYGPLDLSPDEAHYWEWSRRPDWSYYSKGPLVAFFIYSGCVLFGHNEFAIRIWAILFSALASLCLYVLTLAMYREKDEEEKGEKEALAAALIFQAIPLFSTYGVVFTIDSPFLFFWALSLLLFWKVTTLRQPARVWWVLLGLSLGLGLLAKYTMAFFYLCALFYLLCTDRRRLLRESGIYVSAAVSALVFSPVVWWNARNGWVAVRHTAGQAHVHDGFVLTPLKYLEFLGSQIGVITPLLFVLFFVALVKLKEREPGRQSDFLFYFSLPVLAFFLLKSMQGKVQANWAMSGYVTCIVAFARVYYCGGMAARGKRLASWSVGLAVMVTVASYFLFILPMDPEKDPSSKLRGWRELGIELSRMADSMKKDGPLFVFSDKYQVASQAAFYMEGHPVTYCVMIGRRMNQYDLWPDMNDKAKELLHSGRIGSKEEIQGLFVRTGADDLPHEATGFFERCLKIPLTVMEHGQLLRDYSIFKCYGFKGISRKETESY